MSHAIRKSRINELKDLVFQAGESIVKAGKLVCELIDEDPDCIEDICKQCPMFTPEILLSLERVGRGTLHHQLLICDGPGPRRLRKLPFALQEKYLDRPVELLVSGGNTIQCDVLNLSNDQASQVFSSDGVRSLPAQRAYIEDRAVKNSAPSARADLPYRITGGKLVILNACTLTRKELARLLSDMEN